MEDDLKHAMQIIDKHADKMPDGDYLELCNVMRDIYKSEVETITENITGRSIFPEGMMIDDVELDVDSIHHFQNVYENAMRAFDVQLKEMEIKMIDKMIKNIKIIRRITPKIRARALHHYYESHNIYLDDYTDETFERLVGDKRELKSICNGYVSTENRYRRTLVRDLHRRCAKICEEIELVRQGFI
jgi:hypothetical protein